MKLEKGCGKEFHHEYWGDRICGRFEDLKHSDHFIYCPECESKLALHKKKEVKG